MDYVIDATNKKLGRLASEIAVILQGKKRAAYLRRLPGDDRVILQNVRALDLGHRKFEAKVYHRHAGRLGHLKTTAFLKQFERDPRRAIRQVVTHMLPKNRLQKVHMKRLIIE